MSSLKWHPQAVMSWHDRGSREQEKIAPWVFLRCPGKQVLHVGVGNSWLSQGMRDRGADVMGATIAPLEVERSIGLGIPCHLVDKHSPLFDSWEMSVDMIVDINLLGFARTYEELDRYFVACQRKLRSGGCLVTSTESLNWRPVEASQLRGQVDRYLAVPVWRKLLRSNWFVVDWPDTVLELTLHKLGGSNGN